MMSYYHTQRIEDKKDYTSNTKETGLSVFIQPIGYMGLLVVPIT